MQQKILIVGGGIGGLTAAIALLKAGFEVKVFEAAPSFLPVGAGIALAGNAIKAYAAIGIDKKITNAGKAVKSGKILDRKGKELSSVEMEKITTTFGYGTYVIHRAELHETLLGLLPENVVVTGKKCTHYVQNNEKITLCFEDGSETAGNMLIGADGIHSAIRKQLEPNSRLRYAGYTCWRGVCQFADTNFDDTRTTESWGWGERFGICPLKNGQVYWFMVKNAPYKDPHMSAFDREVMGRIMEDWHYPVKELIAATKETNIIWNDIIDLKPIANSWGKGLVTLLGDAAHATTPNLGQGACQAIEDGVYLAKCLKKYGCSVDSLRKFEQMRTKRVNLITRRSWQFGKISQLENPLVTPFRNLFIKLATRNPKPSQMAWLLDVDFEL